MKPATLPALILLEAERRADFLKIDPVVGKGLTAAEFAEESSRWGSALSHLGLSRGDTVVTMLPNGPVSYLGWAASSWIGAIEFPVNTAYLGDWLEFAVTSSGAKVAMIGRRYWSQWAPLVAKKMIEKIVVVDDIYGNDETDFEHSSGVIGQREFLSSGRTDVAPVRAQLFDISCVPFTAGTSGVSKGVISPWGLWPERCESPIIPAEYRTDETIYYSTLPFFHTGGRVYFYRAMYDGGRVVVREVFSTDDWLDDIRTHMCNETILIGSMASFLHNSPVRENDGENPMRHVIVSPVPPWIDEFKDRFQVEVDTAFGSTETLFPIISGGLYEVNSTTFASCGKRDMSIDFRLVDEDDNDVGPNQPGEVLVRGVPWKCNFGYWDMPDASAEAWRDGWFHTGDALRYDEDGFYFFVDRMKDALRRRGENISSAEVEAVVMRHPHVTEAAVFGVPSTYGEEEVMLVVVPRTGIDIDIEELYKYLQESLPYFAVPSYVDVVSSLPSSSLGRVDKKSLKSRGVTENTNVRLQDRRSTRESST